MSDRTKKLMMNMMKMQIIKDGYNIYCPKEFLDKLAERDGLSEDLRQEVAIALRNATHKEKLAIAKQLIFEGVKILDLQDFVFDNILEVGKEVAAFITDHPEYKEIPTEDELREAFEKMMDELGEEDD